MSGLIVDYLSFGDTADRPATPSIDSESIALFYAQDDGILSIWDNSSWFEISIPNLAMLIAGGTIGQALAKIDSTDFSVEWVDILNAFETLSDVDWTTPPTDGQVFAWDTASSKLIPTDQSSGLLSVAGFVDFVPGVTPTINRSENVTSVVQTASGRYRITWASAMSDAYYGVALAGRFGTSSNDVVPILNVDRKSGYGKTAATLDVTINTDLGVVSDNLEFLSVTAFD